MDYKIPSYASQTIPQITNLLKLAVLSSLLISSLLLTQTCVNFMNAYFLGSYFYEPIKWLLVFIFSLFNCLVIMGLGLLGHESTHRVLLKNKFWNDLLGGVMMGFVLLPYYDFREFHLTHHAYTHQPELDPEEMMNNHPIWYALTGAPLVGLLWRYKIMLTNIFSDSWERRFRGIKDVMFLNIAATFYFYFVPFCGISIWYTIVPTLLLMPVIFALRNMSEHHAIPIQDKRSISQTELQKTDSWIILTHPVFSWLWSNTNYHQVHHRYPYLSHRYLPEIFAATQKEQNYLVENGYFRFFINSLKHPYYLKEEELTEK